MSVSVQMLSLLRVGPQCLVVLYLLSDFANAITDSREVRPVPECLLMLKRKTGGFLWDLFQYRARLWEIESNILQLHSRLEISLPNILKETPWS